MKINFKNGSKMIFVGIDEATGFDRTVYFSCPTLAEIFNQEAKRPFYDQVKSLDALLEEINGNGGMP